MTNDKRDFDKAAATWDEEPRRVKLADDVAAAIASEVRLAPEMDVLDFGCGTGLVALRLRPRVRSVTGVDTSAGMLAVFEAKAKAAGLTNVRTRQVDLGRGEALGGRYHLIVTSMVFHHVKDMGAVLKRFHAALHPGGSLCVADLDLEDGKFHEDRRGVFHDGFDRSVFKGAFQAAGFTDVRDRTAAEVTKPASDGTKRTFTVFLLTGRKAS